MTFEIDKSIEILERTPGTVAAMLSGLSAEWTQANEGPDTWTPRDVVAHLIYCEKANWMMRAEIILKAADKQFGPFDRTAHFEQSKGKQLPELLREFEALRKANMEKLKSLNLADDDLIKTGIHPAFGEVTLSQLLSAWVVHDLTHQSQMLRVMAKQYKEAVGPWSEYLRILK